MTTSEEARKAGEEGKRAFETGRFEAAAEMFRVAAQTYESLHDQLNASEQKNNLSVTLLRMGKGREALEVAQGSDEVFAAAGDVRRQGIALNNQAAALEALGHYDEALRAYEKSATLLLEAGEREYREIVLKAAAGIQLKRGKLLDAGTRMIGVMEAREHPSLLDRVLRFILHLVQR